jgi:hypothetical protein
MQELLLRAIPRALNSRNDCRAEQFPMGLAPGGVPHLQTVFTGGEADEGREGCDFQGNHRPVKA